MAATPVSRSTMNEVAVCHVTVRRATSGSCRTTQASLGPIDWLVSGIPVRRRIDAAPMRRSNSSISSAARVSTP